jgi:hypothetical protein
LEKGGVASFEGEESFGIGRGELDDLVDGGVEEGTVMGNKEKGGYFLAEKSFELKDAIKVEVVGGFVKEEKIAGGYQARGKGQSFFPATRKKGGGGRGKGKFRMPELGKLGLFVVGKVLWRRLDEDLQGEEGRKLGGLGEIPDFEAPTGSEETRIGGFKAGQNLEEGRFARAVRTDEADPVPLANGQVSLRKEAIGCKRLRNFLSA